MNSSVTKKLIQGFCDGKRYQERLNGKPNGYGFLFIYELFTKTARSRIGKRDTSFSFARLCSRLYTGTFVMLIYFLVEADLLEIS